MIIYIIFAICLLILYLKSESNNSLLIKSLYLLYFISAISTVIYEIGWGYNKDVSSEAVLYLFIFLLIWFIPYQGVGRLQVQNIVIPSKVKIIAIMLSVLNLIATLYFGYYSLVLFSIEDISVYRISMVDSIFPANLFSNILIYLSSYSPIVLLFFFISIRDSWGKIYEYLLYVSSFSFVMLTMCFAGRDGVVYWFFDFIILYHLFKDTINREKIQLWRMLTIISLSIGAMVLLFVTVKRFSIYGTPDYYLLSTVIDYMGQQTKNFSESFYINMPFSNTLFPATAKFFHIYEENYNKDILFSQNMSEQYNVFGFFAKAIIWGYGKLGGIIISIIISIIVYRYKVIFLKDRNILSFIVLFLLYHIPMYGVFYYRQGIGGMDFSYLVAILAFMFLKKIKLSLR